MGICSASRGDAVVTMVNPASCADTAAATSAYIDCRGYKGDIIFTQHSGAVTGTLAGKLQGADDVGGTNSADITGATFTSVTAANKLYSISVPATYRPFIRYVGTVTTGPVVLGVHLRAFPAAGS
jgi:hypothetical protein